MSRRRVRWCYAAGRKFFTAFQISQMKIASTIACAIRNGGSGLSGAFGGPTHRRASLPCDQSSSPRLRRTPHSVSFAAMSSATKWRALSRSYPCVNSSS